MDYGKRADGTKKGSGFYGEVKRPDGDISTEISVGVGIKGKETQIPLMIPGLTKEEMNYLLNTNPRSKRFFEDMPSSVIDKAVEHAMNRIKEGKSPFAEPDEQIQKVPK